MTNIWLAPAIKGSIPVQAPFIHNLWLGGGGEEDLYLKKIGQAANFISNE
jgi:hypothetical protein